MTFDPEMLQAVYAQAREAMLLQTSADTLEWDERTGMPAGGGAYRAEQVGRLRTLAHRLRTDPAYGEQLARLREDLAGEDPESDAAVSVRELHRDWQRDAKLPPNLVEALASAAVRGQQAWDAARRADDFSMFRDSLTETLSLKREAGTRMAEGTDHDIYETLLDEFEPGARVGEIEQLFAAIRGPLVELIGQLREAPRQPDISFLQRPVPLAQQRAFSRELAERIGFDFRCGRLDETSHPFCTTLGPQDVRILSRYDERWLPGGLFGTLHEAGHGLYEQGLRREWFGLPPGSFASLGVHESQSRMWENQVGRSRAFWEWLLPRAQETFAPALDGVSLDEMYSAVNRVAPSLIRVEADEATYNLHIIIRFDLERQLIDDRLAVDDLPEAWNERYAKDLGIRPPSAADGVLQDVHWSAGLIGYFPTYTLGNVISAQLFATAAAELGDVDALFARGDFAPLLDWLRAAVHRHGRGLTAPELVRRASGQELDARHLTEYLANKLRPLYGI